MRPREKRSVSSRIGFRCPSIGLMVGLVLISNTTSRPSKVAWSPRPYSISPISKAGRTASASALERIASCSAWNIASVENPLVPSETRQ